MKPNRRALTMRCLKSRSTLIRERIQYWESIRHKGLELLAYHKGSDDARVKFLNESKEELQHHINCLTRLINRLYNLLKKK